MQIKFFKLLILAFVLSLQAPLSISAKNGWTPVSKEQAEYNAINLEIARIKERFTAMGAGNCSAVQSAIFDLLKRNGTAVSYKILQELVADGTLPKGYLSQA